LGRMSASSRLLKKRLRRNPAFFPFFFQKPSDTSNDRST
jgi:hypothetical protein